MSDRQLISMFTDYFKNEPSHFIRVPGRVNLIGEHTDYNGFPVMPIAIPRYIQAVISPLDGNQVNISNTDHHHEPASFEATIDMPHSPKGNWANYVKAAIQALSSGIRGNQSGMNAMFGGAVPLSAGLSSSSALVVTSALAFLAVNGQKVEPISLAEKMAEGERYVGTQGGGMDQAICLLGKEGYAVKIDFFPLRATYVPFPADYSIIVANSLVRAAKTENALMHYNRRPAECRLAVAVINTLYCHDKPIQRLGDLPEVNGFTSILDNAENFVNDTFSESSYTLTDLAGITGESENMLAEKYLMTRSGQPMPVPSDGFLVRQRALHVFTEAGRVEKSRVALTSGDVESFGALMNASHESCDTLYGLSTPELNALVGIMKDHGAYGARLTGAGFGGCAVALVHDDNLENILSGVKEHYYLGYIPKHRSDLGGFDNFDEVVFPVKPADGGFTELL
ncbi:galactokinase [Candidatus Latescibacterota bacterium]